MGQCSLLILSLLTFWVIQGLNEGLRLREFGWTNLVQTSEPGGYPRPVVARSNEERGYSGDTCNIRKPAAAKPPDQRYLFVVTHGKNHPVMSKKEVPGSSPPDGICLHP